MVEGMFLLRLESDDPRIIFTQKDRDEQHASRIIAYREGDLLRAANTARNITDPRNF